MKRHRQKAESARDTAKTFEIPGLGHVEGFGGEYVSEPIPVSVLGTEAEVFVEGYDEDERPQDFHAAIEAFLSLDRSVMEEAVAAVAGPGDVLALLGPDIEVTVARDSDGDREVCVSVVGNNRDSEHLDGLQIVFRQGRVPDRR
ncbi:DUF6985 domain-containing protein [Catenulispora rubra]|uniref:DUF6985 domain-containing protein n=1 Tax=Catenulispora rubra TaxID=280293 RepID=UPI0018925943|nr:hypothetical protein [Catenulispora rubra]